MKRFTSGIPLVHFALHFLYYQLRRSKESDLPFTSIAQVIEQGPSTSCPSVKPIAACEHPIADGNTDGVVNRFILPTRIAA